MPGHQLFNRTGAGDSEMADVWDDTALIRMYEESISSTYRQVGTPGGASEKKKKEEKKMVNEEQGTHKQWSVGDRCIAPFEDLYYPATIKALPSGGNNVEVCFDYYENVEFVSLSDIHPEEAVDEAEEEEEEEKMEVKQEVRQQQRPQEQRKRRQSGGMKEKGGNISTPPRRATGGEEKKGFRAPIPSLAPPPPPTFAALRGPSEDQALSSMLMSWYMSGYHTGYYQALQDIRNGKTE